MYIIYMISTIYGYPICKVSVKDKMKMMDEVYLNVKKIGNVSMWDSECLTTSTVSNENKFSSEHVKNEIMYHTNEMIKELGLNLDLGLKMCDTKDCTFCDDIWMNVYKKGHYQVTHTHHSEQPGAALPLFSFSYFAKYNPEKDAKFIFVNPAPSSDCKELHKLDCFKPEITMDVKEGDIIIFPNFMPHRVEEQLDKGPRITISGNLYEQLKD